MGPRSGRHLDPDRVRLLAPRRRWIGARGARDTPYGRVQPRRLAPAHHRRGLRRGRGHRTGHRWLAATRAIHWPPKLTDGKRVAGARTVSDCDIKREDV